MTPLLANTDPTYAFGIAIVACLILIAGVYRWAWLHDRDNKPGALNENTEEWCDPMTLPLSQSRTAQRIRARIDANHEAAGERFRRELEGWGESA